MDAVTSIAGLLLRSTLPYHDPLRRRRIRQAARDLITCERWPGDDATPEDVAQLALLRLLWLQRQTRMAGRLRQTEATALLVRACIETCLAGLYWLYGDGQVERMGSNNAKSFRRLMSYIADGDPISPTLVNDVAATFGTAPDLPSLLDMAKVVAIKRPARVWTVHSALHTADACMARLALALAEHRQMTGAPFVQYANAHMSRSITPVFVMAGRSMIRSVRWSKMPTAYRAVIALRRYYDTGQANDTYPERKARIKEILEEAAQIFANVPEQQRDLILDHFAETLTQSES